MSDPVSVDLLARLQPLTSLSRDGLGDLIALCRTHQFARGSDPFRAADWTGQLVYLIKGQILATLSDGASRVLVGGHELAASPIARGDKSPARSQAITDIVLLSLEEDKLDIILTWNQLATTAHGSERGTDITDWRRMSDMFALDNLTVGVFASLPPANIQSLLGKFNRLPVKRGDTIIKQGDPGDFYYLIESGRCKVTRKVAGSSIELAELKEGNAFGEEALVADTARNATVVMKTDGVLLRLSKADFNELLRAPLLQRVSAREAAAGIEGGAVWIDVRFPAEYRSDGFPGALNIPLDDIRQAVAALDPRKEYIVYCQTGRRSSAAAFLLSQRGFNAALLEGGMRSYAGDMESVQ
ncbi:MAG: cyclic nucleotide-binding domain-containing protein [Sulfuritalea sp.]|jgi:rhodanese-related sulfurtransferase|nr:cyclic nucleotide-binding domain-containing protein [Sulfuritalea sp.]